MGKIGQRFHYVLFAVFVAYNIISITNEIFKAIDQSIEFFLTFFREELACHAGGALEPYFIYQVFCFRPVRIKWNHRYLRELFKFDITASQSTCHQFYPNARGNRNVPFINTKNNHCLIILQAANYIFPRFRSHNICYSSDLIAAKLHRCILLYPRCRRELNKNFKRIELGNNAGQIAELQYQPNKRTHTQYHKKAHNNIAPSLGGFVITHKLSPFNSPRPSINNSLMARKG